MRIEAIPTGSNPPDDINVIIEVPVGGEMDPFHPVVRVLGKFHNASEKDDGL